MNCLEVLPNEILLEIFKYFDAQQLFQAFYNLNFRFNQLIQSFNQLQLTFCLTKSNCQEIDNDKNFQLYVHTLKVDPLYNGKNLPFDISRRLFSDNLSLFRNVRRLKCRYSIEFKLAALTSDTLPYLEKLQIYWIGGGNDIFNGEWILLPSLRTLKLAVIGLSLYRSILSKCNNLRNFVFAITPAYDITSFSVLSHNNLRRMEITSDNTRSRSSFGDMTVEPCLSCVPNLERLTINRGFYTLDLAPYFLDFDCFITIINIHLPLLQRLLFHGKVSRSEGFNKDVIRKEFEEKVKEVDNRRSTARLAISSA
ncbi:unnamed protein product [Adineta steineri]|uniref:F-box domain-containing protein n=1 Tax=Adineta steineri TaxID=433720 RepID=A0A814HPW5_9BILA|nr:unnamed protein product [Adineta steineri]CAF3709330.1 unnamed protein product [Adineta steineri]